MKLMILAVMTDLNTMWVLFFACVVLLALIYKASQIHPGCGWALSFAVPILFLLCMGDGKVFAESLSSRWQKMAFILACVVMMAGVVLSLIPYQVDALAKALGYKAHWTDSDKEESEDNEG